MTLYFFLRTQLGSALFKVECRIMWAMSMRFSSIFCMQQSLKGKNQVTVGIRLILAMDNTDA
jgi:hypothetical protein